MIGRQGWLKYRDMYLGLILLVVKYYQSFRFNCVLRMFTVCSYNDSSLFYFHINITRSHKYIFYFSIRKIKLDHSGI